jgi:putative transposase
VCWLDLRQEPFDILHNLVGYFYHGRMAELSITLKLPFHRLNQVKADEFERLTILNTQTANDLLKVEKSERKKLTSAAFKHIEIGSMWINQTIRNTNAKTKAKHFKRMWLEVNNQGYEVVRAGDLYTVYFSLYRGRKGRIPLEVHAASHTEVLDKLIAGEAQLGTLKICKSKKGIWYALISVSMEVPDAKAVERWIGVDRGQKRGSVHAFLKMKQGFGSNSRNVAGRSSPKIDCLNASNCTRDEALWEKSLALT